MIQSNPATLEIKWKYESDADFFTLKVIADYLFIHLPKVKVSLHCLYLPYSRMDRSENGSVFSLISVASILNDLCFDTIFIGEPHSHVSLEFIHDAEPVNITQALYKEHEASLRQDLPLIPFYPDAGARERYNVTSSLSLVGEKKRDFATGEIVEYKIKGEELVPETPFDVVILDDLSSYGGTFVRAVKELRKIGARKVYLIVAHAENSIFLGDLFNHIDKVITTNSILDPDSEEASIKVVEQKLFIKKMI